MYLTLINSYPFCYKQSKIPSLDWVFFHIEVICQPNEKSRKCLSALLAGCMPNKTNCQCLVRQNGVLCHCTHFQSITVIKSVWKQLLKIFKRRQGRLNSFQKFTLHSAVDCLKYPKTQNIAIDIN